MGYLATECIMLYSVNKAKKAFEKKIKSNREVKYRYLWNQVLQSEDGADKTDKIVNFLNYSFVKDNIQINVDDFNQYCKK